MSEPLARHAIAVASVRELAARSGAERVVLLVDEGDEAQATMVEWQPGAALALTEAGVTQELPADAAPDAPPVALPEIRPAPASALAFDDEQGELAAPLGAVANLAEAVLALATAFGGRSVATAEFATSDPLKPLTIAARPGEPIVAALADRAFAFPEGWP